ncbi:MAG: signal peptide peptidase SppA, partial [Planctomycetota bacterium]
MRLLRPERPGRLPGSFEGVAMMRSIGRVCFSVAVASGVLFAGPRPVVADEADDGVVAGGIVVRGGYKEKARLPGVFGDVEQTLDDLLARFREAAGDEELDALVVTLDGPQIGWGAIAELSDAIDAVQESGKPVFAYAKELSLPAYVLASGCDRVVMPESGTLNVLGIRAEVSFYKGMFDKLDIEPDVLRVGEYKSAAEPYTRTSMSDQFREELSEVLDGIFEHAVAEIAAGRDLSEDAVEDFINAGPHTVEAAKSAGMITDVAYADELEDLVLKAVDDDATALTFKSAYGRKKIDKDFSGFAGFVKFMNLLAGEDASAKTYRPKVAVLYAVGPIMTGRGGEDPFGDATIGDRTLVKAIEKAADDETVVAVVLRVDSPGGSALASDLIWRALEKLDKPLVVSMGSVAASGGYYISMGADRVFATPATITGSIGVVGGKVGLEGLFEKAGITTEVVQRGDNAGAFSLLNGFSDSERVAMRKLLDSIYGQFVSKAAAGRGMEYDTLEGLARGRIYTGSRAVELGLVDELGTLADAIAHAKQMAVDQELLREGKKVELLELPKPISPLESLFGPLDD